MSTSKYGSGSGKGILRQSNDGNRHPKKSASFASSPSSQNVTSASPAKSQTDTLQVGLQQDQIYPIMQSIDFQPYVQYPEYAAYVPQYADPQYPAQAMVGNPFTNVPFKEYIPVPVPVDNIIQVPVHHYIDRTVPVERIVQVPVYVDRYIDRYVPLPVDRPVDRPVYVPIQSEEKQQTYVGIGLSLERADGDRAIYVERLIRGFSAERSGRIQVGDEVVSINDIDVRELSIGTMKQLTVGPVGSQVKLDLLRSSFPYTVFLERLLPTHTTYENAAAAGVLVHPAGGHVGTSVPDGQSVRLGPLYYDALGTQRSSIRRSGDWSGGFGSSAQLGPQRAIPA